MKTLAGSLLAVLLSISVGVQAGNWNINYCKDLTVDEFHAAAKWSFQRWKYQIEEDTPSSLTGGLRGKKVEIAMTDPGHIVIRWVPGFGHGSDKWLNRLYQDLTWQLAE